MDMSPEDHSDKGNEGASSMQEQIVALREQVASLTAKLSESASQATDAAKETASGWYDAAADHVQDVSQVARTFPVAMSSATATGLVLGVLLGLALGHASQPSRPWYDRNWR